MTNSIIKKYSFFDLDLKFENSCFKKNDLTVCESINIDLSKNCIEPLNSFENFLKNSFQPDEYEEIKNLNSPIIKNFKIIYPYSYIDNLSSETKTRYLALDKENNLYELDNSKNFVSLNIKFKNEPRIFVNNLKLFLISNDDKNIYFDKNSSAIFLTDFCNLKCFSKYQNMLFFISHQNKFCLYFTEETEIENLGSNLNVKTYEELDSNNGEVLDIKTFNNNIYVIQQFAITKFSYSNKKITFASLFPIASKIIEASIQQLDDYIVFITSSGLYVFDGSSLKNIFHKNIRNLNERFLSSVSFNEKYYLLLKDTKTTKNILLEFNIGDSKVNTFYYDNITNMYVIKNFNCYKFLICCGIDANIILELSNKNINNNHSEIKFNKLLFDDYNSKILSELDVYSEGQFNLSILTEHEEKTFKISGNTSLRNLGIIGKYFQIKISSETYFKIEAMTFSLKYFSEKL